MAKSLEDFIKFRDTTLSKIDGKKGYMIFDNNLAKTIHKAYPSCMTELTAIPGFPADGVRAKKYGKAIIGFFNGSSVFL